MLVIGVAGTELNARERDWLQHDACAGVILFSRNFASKAQVAELSQAIREAAPRPQLLCVDQEGGRVQRFREGYSALPPLEGFDAMYAREPRAASRPPLIRFGRSVRADGSRDRFEAVRSPSSGASL